MSPFNISQPLAAPFFSTEDVQQLFGQFEKEQQRVRDPGFALEAAIATHVHEVTNGTPDASVRCLLITFLHVQVIRVW